MSRADRIIATLPACAYPGEIQETQGHIEIRGAMSDETDFEIVVSTGKQPIGSRDKVEIGSVEIESSNGVLGTWTPFTNSAGQVLGVYTHVYSYLGAVPSQDTATEYEPFRCSPMPPRVGQGAK